VHPISLSHRLPVGNLLHPLRFTSAAILATAAIELMTLPPSEIRMASLSSLLATVPLTLILVIALMTYAHRAGIPMLLAAAESIAAAALILVVPTIAEASALVVMGVVLVVITRLLTHLAMPIDEVLDLSHSIEAPHTQREIDLRIVEPEVAKRTQRRR